MLLLLLLMLVMICQASASATPVTGMLTMYEDELRFDRAVGSVDIPPDIQEIDESMSCVRLKRHLINCVDISDSSPLPNVQSQFVNIHIFFNITVPRCRFQ